MSRIAEMPVAAPGAPITISTVAVRRSDDYAPFTRLELEYPDQEGLIAAVDRQIRAFSRATGLQCDSLIDLSPDSAIPEGKLPDTTFRIFQEILHNVALHARATAVRIRIRVEPGLLQMDVTDNGMGAPRNAFESPHAFGINSMRKCVQQSGGSLHIVSVPGGGTHVCMRLPLTPPPA